MFLSSHELDEVQRLADRVAIIRSGRLVTTDTVDHLRRSAPRTVEVRFAGPADPSLYSGLEGVTVTASDGPSVTIQLTGPLAPLLKTIADNDPIDLVSRPADLDELFLDLYRDSAPPEASDGE